MKKIIICTVMTMILAFSGIAQADLSWYTETAADAGLVTYIDTTGPYPLFGDPTPHKSGGPSVQTIFEPGDPIFAGAMLDVMAITLPTLNPGVVWGDQSTYDNEVNIEDADVADWGPDEHNSDARFNTGDLTLYDPLGVVVWTDVGSSLSWDNIYVNQSAGHDMLVRNWGVPGGYSFIYENVRGVPIQPGIYTVEFTGYEGGSLAGETQFTVVPVPGAVLLGILGLSAVGIKLRKYA